VLLTGAITVGEVLPHVGSGIIHFFAPKPWSEADMSETLERAAASLEVGRRRGRKTRAEGERGRKHAWLIVLGV
jgi:hypothetical protein